ncbi:hypothetical protein Q5M49_18590 [Acinetobacter nosocomialis]|jgi:hypothetical protein|uniref:Uncharacterized protein n=4 Tax=Acinetobacter nosocomialis TaxID=106654 RepID=A0A1V0YMB7_ACINO|nr:MULTISPECIES: hypothetical protein [Acinetobacter]MDQ9823484.1 hypothetical protein [Acinetobacter sp. 163]ARG15231.1 hypothetical protein B7L44_00610 [Acinetobacter nosocomialis]AVF45992.1 hypothetical protein AL533_17365 [Acinetobacter nosocomialis]AWL20990.1 hypothetical protein DIW83_19320 [Acinetobacter nosocomialis]AZC03511.1 hypothetical protein DKC18_018665 [Acinetobacter nosocomialis]
MEIKMSYYHILIEVNDHISTIEQTRDIELFDIIELKPYLHSILLPYFNEQEIELEDENIEYKDILHLEVKQTLLPIEHLIEEEQKQLPSDTDVTITAYEIFNDRDLSQDVTSVIFDILEAVKLDQSII